MGACWRKFTLLLLCAVLALPIGSSQLSNWQCERREEAEWAGFQTAVKPSGLAQEEGVSRLAADLRTGTLSEPVPHTYVIVGGGEWGPRVVARTVLESVYVDWVSDVYLLDMKDAKSYLDQDGGLEQAQTWLNQHLCNAISRCPQKAAVVLDNVHVLQGENIRLLDTMLSLLDGAKSNMECSGEKMSGERCLFLLLLNEDGSEEAKRLPGKDRLLKAWEFRGLEFTTKAFVGRIDAAVSLSRGPQHLPKDMEADWGKARAVPDDGLLALAAKAWGRAEPGTLQAVGAAAAAAVGVAAVATMLATCWTSSSHSETISSGSGGKCETGTSTTAGGGGGGGSKDGSGGRRGKGDKRKDSSNGTGEKSHKKKADVARGSGLEVRGEVEAAAAEGGGEESNRPNTRSQARSRRESGTSHSKS